MQRTNRTSLPKSWTARANRRAFWRAALVWIGVLVGLLSVWHTPLGAQTPAQEGRVTITGVEDENFPQVSLYLDAFDANGAPVTDLTAPALTLQEDGQPVADLTVTTDTSQPLALLLALDRSTDEATWSAVQSAAATAVESLREQDQFALTTFFDEVESTQSFTADKDAALAALNNVTPGGEFSAVYPAVVDAVSQFDADLPDRRAVVLVADAPDNISDTTPEEVVAQVGDQNVPVYIVGFGERVQDEPNFAQIAAATGGQAFSVAGTEELATILTDLLQDLQVGYRVDFTSNLLADDSTHPVQLTVDGPAVSGSASAEFVARAGSVEVALPNLAAGQPVAGVMDLTITATASTPVARVTYAVDGEEIGAVSDVVTPVTWDTSAVEPGAHTVSVTAEDQVGNVGAAEVEVVVTTAGTWLNIVAVNDETYPQLQAYVDVFGPNGLPVTGLTAQNFSVQEENRSVDPGSIQAQTDTGQPLNVVLVLDRSVAADEWVQLRSNLNTLFDNLREQDQVALYAMAENVTLVQPATSDPTALRSGLATVQPAPPTTTEEDAAGANALNQALLDATNLAATLPEGRRAVIAVTDGLDNQGQIAQEEILEPLGAQSVPVHLLGFGVDSLTEATLTGIAQRTGGSRAAVADISDVPATLEQLLALLQEGYRLDFPASFQVDDQEHSLSVTLNAQEMEAEDTATLIARSRPVTVTVPGIAEGETVGGAVDLTAEAETPAPVTSVEYLLNGDVLAQVDDTSFSVVWNSDTVEPGDYTAEVLVTDAVGNQGRTEVSFTVVPPIALQASLAPGSSDGEIVVGDDAGLQADVEALSENVEVQFFVGNVLVNTDTRAPYEADFDSTEFGAGSHTVTVVARDDEGHEASTTLALNLAAPPDPAATVTPSAASQSFLPASANSINWGRWLLYLGIALLVLLLLLVGWMVVRNAGQIAADQKLTPMRVSLTNSGNVATGYLLRGEDSSSLLSFQFSVNGAQLGPPPVARREQEDAAGQGSNGNAGNRPGVGLPNMQKPDVNLPSGQGGMSLPQNWSDVGDKLQEAGKVGRIISDIINTVAMFLPHSLRQPLRRVSRTIRSGQRVARRVERVQKRVGQLNESEMGSQLVDNTRSAAGEAGRVAQSESTRQQVAQAGQRAGSAATAAAGTAVAGAGRATNKFYGLSTAPARQAVQQSANAAGTASGVAAGGRQWVYLPNVDPGQTVTIDVLVGARKSVKGAEHYPFRILSRAVSEEEGKPVVEEGSIRIAGKSWWQRNLGLLLGIGLGTVVLLAAVIMLLVWIF